MGAWDENFGGGVATVADQRAPSAIASVQGKASAWDENFGEPSALSPQPTAPSPNAEPDAPSWWGRRMQDVRGKRDPHYAGLPTVAEAMNREGTMSFGNAARESGAWLTGASDKDMAGVYRRMLGERFVRDETDANGYPVIVYKGQSGQEAKAYVNQPGLDMQDVVRGIEGVAPFVGAGRLVSGLAGGASLLPRIGAQAGGQAATSVAQDATGALAGVSGVDLQKSAAKAGMAAAGGAAGEVGGQALGFAWRKLVSEPRFFNRSAGRLTPAGEDAARQAGLDPATLPAAIAQDFGRAMARTGDPAASAMPTISNEFRIPLTQGEITGSTQRLLREQQMQGGAFGDSAARHMDTFRRTQGEAIDNATRGMISPSEPGIAGNLAPARAGARMGKDELGSNIRANTQAAYDTAKAAENRAWAAVPDEFRANSEALAAIDTVLPRTLAARGVRVVEEGLTPAAQRMSDMIVRFQAGEMPVNASKFVNRSLAGHVDIMRRRLLSAMESAETPTDRRAAKAMYDGFNDWIVEAAKMSGDPSAAARMVAARGISRQIHEVFDGPQGTAGARIMSSVLRTADSAEGVVNALFSAPSRSEIKGGAIHALDSLKRAYDTHLPPEAARAAWDDIRLAYWMRIAETRTGDVAGPEALANSIRTAINSQSSLARRLFTPSEIAQMNRLARVLYDVGRRNPNSSWSGVSIGSLLKDLGNAALSMIGANSVFARTAIGTVGKPVIGAYGTASARAATGGGTGATVGAPTFRYGAGPAGGIAATRSNRQ